MIDNTNCNSSVNAVWRELYLKTFSVRNIAKLDLDMKDKSWKARFYEAVASRNGTSFLPRQNPNLIHLSTTEIRIMILGAIGVGKSAITTRYVKNHFVESDKSSFGPARSDSFRKQISFFGSPVVLDILDLARGDEKTLSVFYFVATQGFVLMYSVTDYSSFTAVSEHYERLQKSRSSAEVPVVLVGNKIDLFTSREVMTEEGIELAKKWKVPFFEISAKTAVNVTELFTAVTWEAVLHKKLGTFGERQEKCIVM